MESNTFLMLVWWSTLLTPHFRNRCHVSWYATDRVLKWTATRTHNMVVFYNEELLAAFSVSKLEDYPLLATCDCLLSIFIAALHIWRVSTSILMTCHAVVTRDSVRVTKEHSFIFQRPHLQTSAQRWLFWLSSVLGRHLNVAHDHFLSFQSKFIIIMWLEGQ